VSHCPHCGQQLPTVRCGVRLSPLKARLLDAIRRAGPDGISSADLINELHLPFKRKTLAAHAWQINELLELTEYRIRGRGGYRLVRLEGAPR
jgi:hypothetical protein